MKAPRFFMALCLVLVLTFGFSLPLQASECAKPKCASTKEVQAKQIAKSERPWVSTPRYDVVDGTKTAGLFITGLVDDIFHSFHMLFKNHINEDMI